MTQRVYEKVFAATYPGDRRVSAGGSHVYGPNTLGEYFAASQATYTPETNCTRIIFRLLPTAERRQRGPAIGREVSAKVRIAHLFNSPAAGGGG